MGFPGGLVLKNPLVSAGDVGSIPGSEGLPVEEMGTHSSAFAWEIPWTEKPHRLPSIGSQKSWTQLSN